MRRSPSRTPSLDREENIDVNDEGVQQGCYEEVLANTTGDALPSVTDRNDLMMHAAHTHCLDVLGLSSDDLYYVVYEPMPGAQKNMRADKFTEAAGTGSRWGVVRLIADWRTKTDPPTGRPSLKEAGPGVKNQTAMFHERTMVKLKSVRAPSTFGDSKEGGSRDISKCRVSVQCTSDESVACHA